MGKKTYESIGIPLPNRKNIILSKTLPDEQPGIFIYRDLEELNKALSKEEDVFIIGGKQIYEIFIDKVDVIYRSIIPTIIEIDSSTIVFDIYSYIDRTLFTKESIKYNTFTLEVLRKVASKNNKKQ